MSIKRLTNLYYYTGHCNYDLHAFYFNNGTKKKKQATKNKSEPIIVYISCALIPAIKKKRLQIINNPHPIL